MSTTMPIVIKVKQGFRRFLPQDVLSTSVHICTKVYNSPFFMPPQSPPPPIDQATLKGANDSLSAAIAAAIDGSRQSITQRNDTKEAVVKLLEQLGIYVQANCKGDMNEVISSGFTAASSTKKLTPPVSESIRKIESGKNSGEMSVVLMKYPKAAGYELRWGIQLAGGAAPTTWSSVPIRDLRPAFIITGLTPGATYVFQARAVLHGGYSDWGDPIARIAL